MAPIPERLLPDRPRLSAEPERSLRDPPRGFQGLGSRSSAPGEPGTWTSLVWASRQRHDRRGRRHRRRFNATLRAKHGRRPKGRDLGHRRRPDPVALANCCGERLLVVWFDKQWETLMNTTVLTPARHMPFAEMIAGDRARLPGQCA